MRHTFSLVNILFFFSVHCISVASWFSHCNSFQFLCISYICFSTQCKNSLNIDILREIRCIFWWLPMALYRIVICRPAMVAEMKCQGPTWHWLHTLKLDLAEMEWGLDVFFISSPSLVTFSCIYHVWKDQVCWWHSLKPRLGQVLKKFLPNGAHPGL